VIFGISIKNCIEYFIFYRNIFSIKFRTEGDHRIKFRKKMAEGEYRSKFDGKNISIKFKLFDAVFYADSEYHIYFALESIFDS
jgi:hypothetical protein